MVKTPTHTYTPEVLADWERGKLELLRDNARRLGAEDVLQMCERELARRVPQTPRKRQTGSEHAEGDVVTGYHFVCARGRGVTESTDGRFWSGSWVVAERNVRESLKYGAHLALHETKAEPSYRQGEIVDYRRSPRDMIDKDNEGIEFLVQETGQSYDWVGAGAGEKGYQWSKRSSRGGLARKGSE
ncbi:MAG: hypothetical protein KF810_08380 [Rhizobiaceae bacterium]|nr:hypothetical protein [Rhizobiaceae bacterium]